jgi:cytochrome c oxidase subunit III
MTAHAEPMPGGPAHHGNANEHPPPIHYSSRINPAVVGIFLFIGSEIMLFGSFFTVYFFDRVVNAHSSPTGAPANVWPPYIPGTHTQWERPWFLALINTLILVTSSFTMHWATTSCKKGDRAGLRAGMVLTLLLGTTFLLTQVVEYHRIGFNTGDSSFAATFFGLTGLHACHVFVGLTILLAMTVRSFRGHFSPEHHHGLEVGGIYWHFVDVMWIVVYVTVYLL